MSLKFEFNADVVDEVKAEYDRRRKLLPIGTVMTPKSTIRFSDGTCHVKGGRYKVTEQNQSYYVVCFNCYDIVK